jgi:CRP-like cAMP-binding protein/Fe-S-cluster-containing hydrogenase component 2
MPADIYFDELAHAWEEEGLFARDAGGQLIRVVSKTEEDYTRFVTVTIDGEEIQVPRAVPTTDAQGNIVYVDASGRTLPRATTIHDAARRLIERRHSRELAQNPQAPPPASPIPTLCHLDHLQPAGVCRVCSVAVETYEIDRRDPTKKKPKRGEKLVPACVQPVEDNMVVYTLHSPDEKQRAKVAGSVRVLLELLAADHAPNSAPAGTPPERLSDFERLLARYGDRLGIDRARFAPRQPLAYPLDDSSPLMRVDHNACILCDRCVRSCTDVKENFVIGRTGKGYAARIGFDLGVPMGDSSCVECGECMLSCPTTALTFRQPIDSDWFREQVGESGKGGLPGKSPVTPAEMEENVLLRTLPWRDRQWNQSSVVRWRLKKGDVLCRLGDYGSTAFILNQGEFGFWIPKKGADGKLLPGWDQGAPAFTSTEADLILGEMTILSLYPRTATIRALADCDVFEVRRNVLFTLQKNPQARELLDGVYRQRAINAHLRQVPLFAELTEADRQKCLDVLRGAGVSPASSSSSSYRPVELLRVAPGETIFRQGERADCFYMIRIGHVKVTQTYGGSERVLDYLRPNRSFGEIACLGDFEEIRAAIPPDLRGPLNNRRTTSCAALDDVELVRIDARAFRQLLSEVPALKEQVLRQAREYLARQQSPAPAAPLATASRSPAAAPRKSSALLGEFLDQGLYNAQRLLVLDLEACTRCDECTKACSDTHDGVTRLIREGLRLDKWLVASSCRSCTDPYCLVGCPVDAIHRLDPASGGKGVAASAAGGDPARQRIEIQIESHCIGCGLCANNCPYGNINMHAEEHYDRREKRAVLHQHATTCDLCGDIVGSNWRNVSCVFACPHHAAHRVTGDELVQIVQGSKRP